MKNFSHYYIGDLVYFHPYKIKFKKISDKNQTFGSYNFSFFSKGMKIGEPNIPKIYSKNKNSHFQSSF